jgi:hypothetical protein
MIIIASLGQGIAGLWRLNQKGGTFSVGRRDMRPCITKFAMPVTSSKTITLPSTLLPSRERMIPSGRENLSQLRLARKLDRGV